MSNRSKTEYSSSGDSKISSVILLHNFDSYKLSSKVFHIFVLYLLKKIE